MSNHGFSDAQFQAAGFKKKELPGRVVLPKPQVAMPTISAKPDDKSQIREELARNVKTKTVGGRGEPKLMPMATRPGVTEDLGLTASQHSAFSNGKSDSLFNGGLGKKPSNHTLSVSSAKTGGTNKKHGKSDTQTANQSETVETPEGAEQEDELTESLDSKLEQLRQSGALNKRLFNYLYEENMEGKDLQGYIEVAKLDKNFEDILIESQGDSEQLTSDRLKEQIEKLEMLKQEVEKTKKANEEAIKSAEEFKQHVAQIADLPADFQEVADRISTEIYNEHKSRNLDAQPEGENKTTALLQSVQNKLQSTLYGFRTDKTNNDKLERIRALDKLLSEKEQEERAVKTMILEERKKQREEEARLGGSMSDSRTSMSKSDFFMTQNRQAKKPSNQAQPDKTDKPNTASTKEKRTLTRPKSQQDREEIPATSKSVDPSQLDHIRRNIEALSMSEHDRFLKSMDPKKLARYEELVKEIEAGLDSNDPEEFKRVSKIHYEIAYGYPEELRAKFEEIDNRILDIMTEEPPVISPTTSKDVIRERVEQKELKKKLKALDDRIDQIRNDTTVLPSELINAKIGEEITAFGEENLKNIKEGIDLSAFEDLEELDEEAKDLLSNIDIGALENYLQGCIDTLEETEKRIKEEEMKSNADPIAPEYLEQAQAFAEDYLTFLEKNKVLLDEFKIHDSITCEDDFEGYEQKVRDRLLQNVDRLEEWYAAAESGRQELDRLYIENKLLEESLKSVPMRDPERFDEELTKELQIKYPEIFKDTPTQRAEVIEEERLEDEDETEMVDKQLKVEDDESKNTN